MRSVKTGMALCGWLLLVPAGAFAQATGTSKVTGTVTDSSGASIAAAEVTLASTATNVNRAQQTSAGGEYVFVDVQPGTYSITVQKQGFREAIVPSLKIDVARSYLVNVVMQIGEVTEKIEVTVGAGVELQTTDATVGDVIAGDLLQYLPNESRDATSLLQLQPLVIPGRGVGQDFGGGVAGSRSDQSTLILDGGDATPSTEGTGGYTTNFIATPQAVVPTPADSVEEFRVGTSTPNANFDRSAGGAVYLVSKRGSNTFHGSTYYYGQNSALNANTWDRNSVGQANPVAHQSRFGLSAGGPIIKSKLFIFGLYEGWRYPHSADILRLVPSDTLKQGILRFSDAAGNTVNYNLATSLQCGTAGGQQCDPRSLGISPVIQAVWKLMPKGNDPSVGDGLNTVGFRSPAAIPFDSNFGMTRADYKLSEKWSLTGTYRYYRQDQPTTDQIDIAGVVSHRPGQAVSTSDDSTQPRYTTLTVTGQITPVLINTFTLNWSRNWWAWGRINPGPLVSGTDAALAITGQNLNQFLDQPINVDTGSARSRTWNSKIWVYRDDLTWVKGAHTFSFGGDFRHDGSFHERDDKQIALTSLVGEVTAANGLVIPPANRPPTCVGSLTQDCLQPGDESRWNVLYSAALGIIDETDIMRTRNSSLNLNPVGTPISANTVMDAFDLYVTDTWHLKPSLTLTAGLSYGVQFPVTERRGEQTVMVDPTTGKLWTVSNFFNQFVQAENAGQFFAPNLAWEPIIKAGLKYPYVVDWADLGPRLALSWNPSFKEGVLGRLFGDRKTVLRGGFYRIFDRINDVNPVMVPSMFGVGFSNSVSCIGPDNTGACRGFGGTTPSTGFRIGPDGSSLPIANISPTAQAPLIPTVNSPFESYLDIVDYDMKPGRYNGYNFTLQRELPGNTILEIGYIGRRMNHLYQTTDFTQVPIFMKDNKSGQTFAQAFDAVATAVRKGNPVVPQPWFEDLTGPGSTVALASAFNSDFQVGLVHDLWNGGITPLLSQPGSNQQVLIGQWVTGSGIANYDGGFISLHKRISHGLTFELNYTLSHTLDEIGLDQLDTGSPSYSANLHYDYGPALFDRRHVFNLLWMHELPFGKGHLFARGNWVDTVIGGWFWSGIFTAASGLPLSVAQGSCEEFGDSPFSNCANAVPLRSPSSFGAGVRYGVTGSAGIGTSGNINMFADPAAVFNSFRPILISQDTTSGGGGYLRGLSRWNLDLSLGKKTQLSEKVAVILTFDFFNAPNHIEFADPSLNLTSPASFGVLNSSFGARPQDQSAARAIQFGLRVKF